MASLRIRVTDFPRLDIVLQISLPIFQSDCEVCPPLCTPKKGEILASPGRNVRCIQRSPKPVFPFEIDHQVFRRNRGRSRNGQRVSKNLEFSKLEIITDRQGKNVRPFKRERNLGSDHDTPDKHSQKRRWEQTPHKDRSNSEAAEVSTRSLP